jgi:hypothetical protein
MMRTLSNDTAQMTLREQDRIRREAKARLRQTISLIQREAAERGLTDAVLERLIADES